MDAPQETDLRLVDVAESGHDRLVEKGLPQRQVFLLLEPDQRLFLVPLPQWIRTQVAYEVRFLLSRDEVHDGEPESDRNPIGRLEDDPYLPAGVPESLARPVEVPDSIHLEMGVEQKVARHTEQHVFAV